ncbi:MAG: tail fiber domain-containing protein [Bacteroidota bacterium]
MKKTILTVLILLAAKFSYTQVGINTTGALPAVNAILDVSSTTKGALLPRMTTAQRIALPTSEGLTVYDTDAKSYWYYNGTAWVNMATGMGGSVSDWVTTSGNTYLQNLSGNVGIGTNTPSVPLSISHGGGANGILLKAIFGFTTLDIDGGPNGDAAVRFYKEGISKWNIRNEGPSDNFQIFESNSGPRIVVENTTGHVGIGTESPVNILDINGRARIRHNGVTSGIWFNPSTNATTNADGAFVGMETNTSVGFWINNAWRLKLSSTGNLTISGTLTESDQRLKKDIKKVEKPLAKIEGLNGYNYHWISNDRDPKLQAGVLAQEVEKVMPELVNEDSTGTKSVNYIGIIPYLIESIKELKKEIEILKHKN